jgi:hypothetical protein
MGLSKDDSESAKKLTKDALKMMETDQPQKRKGDHVDISAENGIDCRGRGQG